MTRKIPFHPKYPERICWGCDKYCAADDLQCGNGAERSPHPVEIFGHDWHTWGETPFSLTEDDPSLPRP